ncbi:hypothetical protein KP509_24G068500 [Ceratopteris richardii]|uniref:Uncharacterized protein n=1 Tax=Ceratopteris richardii TaxID=49495 RepID=A0A8T2RYC3_CERRI|nr:hypothetical protein KP509_24G068500 [Ceratopteris richardii]
MQQRRSSRSIPRLVPASPSSPSLALGALHSLSAAPFDFKRSPERKSFRPATNSLFKERHRNIWDSSNERRCSSVDLCVEAWKPRMTTHTSSYHVSADVFSLDCSQQPFPFSKVSAMQNREHIRHEEMLRIHMPLAIGEDRNKQIRWFTACAMAYGYVHGHQTFLQVLQPHDIYDYTEQCLAQQYIHESVKQHEAHIPEGGDLCDLSQITSTINMYKVNPENDRGKRTDNGEDYSVRGTCYHANSSVVYGNDKHSTESNGKDATTDNPITSLVIGGALEDSTRPAVSHDEWQDVDKNSSPATRSTLRDSVHVNSEHETSSSSSYTENEVICIEEIVNPTQAAKWFGPSFLRTSALVS